MQSENGNFFSTVGSNRFIRLKDSAVPDSSPLANKFEFSYG